MDNLGTYQKVIQAIHANWSGSNNAFALRDVASVSGVSVSSVVRTLKVLKKLHMVTYTTQCYAGRHYHVGSEWPASVKEAVDMVDFAKVLKL